MRRILSERNLVVVLFVMVLVTFALAQEDSKKMERMYSASGAGSKVILASHSGAQNQGNISRGITAE